MQEEQHDDDDEENAQAAGWRVAVRPASHPRISGKRAKKRKNEKDYQNGAEHDAGRLFDWIVNYHL